MNLPPLFRRIVGRWVHRRPRQHRKPHVVRLSLPEGPAVLRIPSRLTDAEARDLVRLIRAVCPDHNRRPITDPRRLLTA